jgi:molybdopterin biosynthesis enzyme
MRPSRPLLLMALATIVLALPGQTLAASDFNFRVLQDVCRANGGDFDRGRHRLKVRVEEQGKSGANRFTLDAKVLHRKANGGEWTSEYTWDRFKVTFPNDADSYYHERWFRYDPKDRGLHKIVVVIRVWRNQTVLAARTINGTAC